MAKRNGDGNTTSVSVFTAEQLLLVPVTVYTVVDGGETTGDGKLIFPGFQ
mgnify:CR=1 FL=1